MHRGIVLIFAIAVTRLDAQQPVDSDPPSPPSQIRTSATATRSVPPDLAVATFEFSARGRTLGEAARAAGTTRDAIRRALTKAGVPGDSILTPGFDYPREENTTIEVKPNPEFRTYDTTYVFRDRLVARMKDLQRLGPALDAALAAGAQKLTSLQFSTSRSEQARQEALKEASRQVRRNAELMAEAAGGKLGRLLDLSTDAGRYQDVIYEAQAANLAVMGGSLRGTSIKPTNIDTQVSVYGRWEFVPVPETAPGR
jgi:uncharacterized protein